MRKTLYLLGALAIIVGAATQHTSTQSPAPVAVAPAPTMAPTVANVALPTLSAEEQQMLDRLASSGRLAAMREQVRGHAQRAVRDEAERGFREPTAAEAAALALGAPQSLDVEVALSGSGMALKTDVSSLEFVKGTVEKDGTVVTHNETGARRDQ